MKAEKEGGLAKRPPNWGMMSESERSAHLQEYWTQRVEHLDKTGRIRRRSKKIPQSGSVVEAVCIVATVAVIFYALLLFASFILIDSTAGEMREWDWEVSKVEAGADNDLGAEYGVSLLMIGRQEEYREMMELGKGIDLNSNVLGDVVDHEGEVQGLSKPEMKTLLDIVSEEHQKPAILRELIRSDLPFQSLKGELQHISEIESNKTSIFIVIVTTVVSGKVKLKGADMKPYLRNILDNSTLPGFLKVFGTHYISGYTNGAQFVGVIEIFTESERDKAQIKAFLNTSSVYPNFFVSLEAQLEERRIAHRKNVRMHLRGAEISKLPVSVADLMAAHEEFVGQARNSHPRPLVVECSPYTNLPSIAGNQRAVELLESYPVTKGRIETEDGEYEGIIKEHKPSGFGTMRYGNGSVYEGEWRNGSRHGNGVQREANGDKYEGEWRFDSFHGKGVWVRVRQFEYRGGFAFGKRSGYGTLKLDRGHYEGQFVTDQFEGLGKYTYSNGDWYEGAFAGGRREGHGTLVCSSGDRYEGDFKNDSFEGNGTYVYGDGRKYVGEFRGGLRHGQGLLVQPGGSSCRGGFKGDLQHGPAICDYFYFGVHWSRYEEVWKRGKRVSFK